MPPGQGLDSAAYLVPGIHLWSSGLTILTRLYTSVIVLNPEKWTHKESYSTDLSPTTIFTPRDCHDTTRVDGHDGRGGVPGVGDDGWLGGVLYRVPTQHPPRTIFSHIPETKAYLRPNEGYFGLFNEVS